MKKWVLLIWWWLCLVPAWAQPVAPDAAPSEVLVVYVREGCPHCAAAKAWLPGFAADKPWLRIEYRSVDTDRAARDELVALSRAAGEWPPGVPSFAFRGALLVGFDDAASSGAAVAALIERGRPQARGIDSDWFGEISVSRLGLPLFTLAIGLLDGFNPCAMWVLLFLLSMLVHLKDRRRMALIAGTFVLVSGLVYYAFMAAWLNVFLAVGMSDALRLGLAFTAILIGLINVKDFYRPFQGLTLSVPDAAKPGLYARMRNILKAETLLLSLAGVATLAVVVNIVELLCTAGLPAMYTAILTQQGLSDSAYYGYLGLYILGYIADDSLMVGTAVYALSSRKLTESAGRWLKLVSGAVMLGLGVVMLVKPEWLA